MLDIWLLLLYYFFLVRNGIRRTKFIKNLWFGFPMEQKAAVMTAVAITQISKTNGGSFGTGGDNDDDDVTEK